MHLNILLKTLGLSLALLLPSLADTSLGSLTLSKPWVRPGTASKNTAAYITIDNPSLTKDKLLKVEGDAGKVIELHDHINEDGVMKMRPVTAINIETSRVELKPGSLHIMLMDLKKDLKENDSVKMRLTFEKAGSIDIDFAVGQPAATGLSATQPSAAPAA